MQKIALITGSAVRIGHTLALFLSKNGWSVAIHYHHSKPEAEALLHEITADKTRKAIAVQADLTNEDEARSLLKNINNSLGQVSLLINNAASFVNDSIDNCNFSSWQQNLTVNLQAPTILCQEFAKQYQGSEGNIINILDYCVLNLPGKKFLSYSVSKYALLAVTKILASELAPNIRVNAIGPGLALIGQNQPPEKFQQATLNSPLKGSTNLQEICSTIKFLLDTKSITGQIIALDGGKHLPVAYDYF